MSRIVIIGGGQAGVQLADSLRSEGYQGAIDLFADEPHLPYQRPPLSKDFMSEEDGASPLPLRAGTFFGDRAVDFHQGVEVTSVDPVGQTVVASDGSTLSYTKLVFATGARNREISVPGSELVGIRYLRTLDDAKALQAELGSAKHVVVIGAGFIGLEFAAAARKRGLDVTVLEFGPRPMGRVLSQFMSGYFADVHTDSGINLKLGEGIASLTGVEGKVSGAVSTSGTEYPADLVVVGIGVLPNSELAVQACLEVDNGIVVDACLQTSDPHIFALGDCSSYPNVHTGARIRLESVQNATDQARILAKTLTGKPTPYEALPWFWSQQGAVKLQIAGIIHCDDESIVRGEPASGKFSVYCFRDGRLTGVESVNSPSEHMAARKVLEQRLPLTPELVMDADFDPKSFSRQSAFLNPNDKEGLERPATV
ncbi:NAD(P)/FAD-dependent oxidoreductase [Arthrobacter sp. ok362]|uniref:NAD(P)/FAD-dependent oxidoreductase n=1 Tax=Arthrobacter sp. ok362 TaxID=1761745 RepID=UPI0008833546|nr:FAD-dependent oxidoreductase [Arthrobacter sp. ok362]SDL16429.1 3-phenylpropionate/trans-cinnamate dioxygenase ferredoxin reductase subunit [Arthrobacter sp. ok362]